MEVQSVGSVNRSRESRSLYTLQERVLFVSFQKTFSRDAVLVYYMSPLTMTVNGKIMRIPVCGRLAIPVPLIQ